jgi:alkanesulfonate monooxygenase SsuD/methylene tetrahydromethanopterin reductase-like flavin-dependent oxidoreductase (luciferase family)
MPAKPFHLAWFMNFVPDEWDTPLAARGRPMDGQFYVEMAKAMERACFDYILIEDTLMISDAYGGTTEAYLKNAIKGPQHDPSPLAALIGANTTKMGVVATFSTMGYPPFLLARLCATLDHICGGRFGWNIVTSGEDYAAMNFGLDKLPPRQERYDVADEYVALCRQLWASWEPDAVVMDRETHTYTDYTKVRRSTSRANISNAVARSTPRPARRADRRSCRQAARHAGASLPPRPPTRSLHGRRASKRWWLIGTTCGRLQRRPAATPTTSRCSS